VGEPTRRQPVGVVFSGNNAPYRATYPRRLRCCQYQYEISNNVLPDPFRKGASAHPIPFSSYQAPKEPWRASGRKSERSQNRNKNKLRKKMPTLRNPKHEKFAQFVAKGITAQAGFTQAGYPNRKTFLGCATTNPWTNGTPSGFGGQFAIARGNRRLAFRGRILSSYA
jgi:hypothetical protein